MFLHHHASCPCCDLCSDPLLGIPLHQAQPLCMTLFLLMTSTQLSVVPTLGSHQFNECHISMVHQIYEPNYSKFHTFASCSKEGRLIHPLFGFLFKPHYHRVKSRCFTACSPAYIFSDPTFHTHAAITLAKRTNFPKTRVSFFLCRHLSCDLTHKWYRW